MKTKIYTTITVLFLTAISCKTLAQNANTSLSNLISPTKVNVNLLPDKDHVRNLGSLNKAWENLYLTDAVYLGGVRFLAYKPGVENTAVGADALKANGNGFHNTASGFEALYSNAGGYENTANGRQALYSSTFGYANTALGDLALYNSNSGSNNTACGYEAGQSVKDGENNVFIGYAADCGSGGSLHNSSAIGNYSFVNTNNTVRIGNTSITSIGGYADWSNLSDGRVKKNINQNVPGLSFINKLQPITYKLDLNAVNKILNIPEVKDDDGKIIQPSADELTARKEKEQIVYTGFIAQDVEKAAKELNYDFSGVDAAKNEHDLYGLRYSEFVVPLVKAVQELSKMNDNKDEKINNLQKEIDELKAMMIANAQSSSSSQSSSITLNNASLEQNIPNPFNHTTTIRYTLPQTFSSAQIIITDNSGKTLKQINVSGSGKGSVNVDASTLSAGAYNYSLIVDGKMIGTKQMALTR